MKLKYYLNFKIIYNSGKVQRIRGFKYRTEDKDSIDSLKEGIVETVKTVFRDNDTAIINIADSYINIKNVSFISIKEKFWIW